MKKARKKFNLPRIFKFVYLKLFRIHDSPQRIAAGLGLGVFLGILPGTGPIASLFLAYIFRLNRASALLGSLLTNTWLSIVTFLLSVKVGAFIFGLRWQDISLVWKTFLDHFHWQNLFKLALLETVFPVIVGYIVVSFFIGLAVYLISLAFLVLRQRQGGIIEKGII